MLYNQVLYILSITCFGHFITMHGHLNVKYYTRLRETPIVRNITTENADRILQNIPGVVFMWIFVLTSTFLRIFLCSARRTCLCLDVFFYAKWPAMGQSFLHAFFFEST